MIYTSISRILSKLLTGVSRLENVTCKIVPDEVFIKLKYFAKLGRFPDLREPKRFSEKLQWLKLNAKNPFYSKLVDKYEVRKFVSSKIGEEYLLPLLGIWEDVEDIDLRKLPDQFVLKCTHDSGSIIICTDKENFDFCQAKKS